MLKSITLTFLLVALAIAVTVPCTQYQASKFGTASDCSINRVNTLTISWGAKITFSLDGKWGDKSYSNVLADMTSPRLPQKPVKSSCVSPAGNYNKGASVMINCTQSFDAIPTGYVNAVNAFDDSDYPLGFSLKVPLNKKIDDFTC